MINWFKNIFTRSDYIDPSTYKGPAMTEIPPIPNIPKHQIKDHYRVGYDSETGATTLTLHADYTSMTLSLSPEEVMRLIRMLAASLDDDIMSPDLGIDEEDE